MTRSTTMLLPAVCLVLISASLAQDDPAAAAVVIKAKLEERVLLPCRQDKPKEECSWTHNVFGNPGDSIGVDSRYPEENSGYSFPNMATDKDDCTLEITKATERDDGVWACNIRPKPSTVTLMLIETPTNALKRGGDDITNQVIHINTDETEVEIQCESVNGRPPPTEFQWTVNGQVQAAAETVLNPTSDDRRSYSTLKLEFPTVENGGVGYYGFQEDQIKEKQINCLIRQASYDSGEAPILKTVLGRKYETDRVDFIRDPTNNHYVTCKANGIPAPEIEFQKSPLDKDSWTPVRLENNTVTEPGRYKCVATYENGNKHPSLPVEFKTGGDNGGGVVTTESSAGSPKADTAAIVGIVVGALVLLALIGGITLFTFKKKKLCFSGVDRHEGGQGTAENGVQRPPKPEEKRMVSDKKEANQPNYGYIRSYNRAQLGEDSRIPKPEGDQNENMKPKEIVYAELDLAKKNGAHSPQVKPPQQAEKTEYAQIKFQPKENQV